MSFQLPGSSEAPSGVKLQTRVTERPAPNDKVFVKAEPVVAVKRESQANGSEPEPSGKRPRLSRGSESGDGAGELPTTKAKGFKAHSSGIVPQIENVVATANLQCSLDLKATAMKANNLEYNPKKFQALILRIKDPRTTALVFASGKMVIMGAKSETDARNSSKRFAEILRKTGTKVTLTNFKIHNVVGCADVKFRINLEQLYVEHQVYCTYDPEAFPGLTYRMTTPYDVVILVFHSGKVVLTKGKTREQVHGAFERMYPVLERFKDRTPAASAGK